MKKLLLTLIGLLIGLTSYSQITQWDTIITHDIYGNLSQRHTQQFNWYCMKPSSRIIETYDTTNLIWKNEFKYLYSYDYNGNITNELQQHWDSTWYNDVKIEYEYIDNQLTTQIYSVWDDTIWTYDQKYTYTYIFGKVQDRIVYLWDFNGSGTWDPFWKYTNLTFNADGEILTSISQRYTNGWKNEWFTENTYIPFGSLQQSLYKDWNNQDSTWNDNFKFYYIFDTNFNIIEHILQYYQDSIWINDQGGNAIFDSNNDRIEYIYKVWDTTGVDHWKNMWRLTTIYDLHHNSIAQVCDQYVEPGWWFPAQNFMLMVNSYNNRYYINNEYSYGAHFTMLYNNIEDINKEIIKIYPNPTTDYVFFNKQFKDVKIFDIQGRLLKNENNIDKINLLGFVNGVYIININNQSKIKIIKQ